MSAMAISIERVFHFPQGGGGGAREGFARYAWQYASLGGNIASPSPMEGGEPEAVLVVCGHVGTVPSFAHYQEMATTGADGHNWR
jgi:hypothetical protein